MRLSSKCILSRQFFCNEMKYRREVELNRLRFEKNMVTIAGISDRSNNAKRM